jgi:hypothetical protein
MLKLPAQALQLRQPLSLGVRGGNLAAGLGLQALDEQPRVGEQALAQRAVALVVVIEPGGQFPGRERLAPLLRQEGLGIRPVGARQRRKDPVGRPAGDHALAHRLLQRLRERREQCQAPVHPTGVPAHARGQGTLTHPLRLHGREQPGLLDGLKGARLMACQHLPQGLGQPATPDHAVDGVPPQAPERLPAPVAVHQHQPLAGLHHHQRHLLAARLQGGEQPTHRLGALHPGVGEGGVDAVPIDRLAEGHGGRVHGRTLCPPPPQDHSVLSLQSRPSTPQAASKALITKRFRALTHPLLQSLAPCQRSSR